MVFLGLASGSSLFDPASGHGDHHAVVSEGMQLVEHQEGHDSHAVSEHAESHDAHGHGFSWGTRVKAVLWQTNIYFIGIAVIGLFFYCIQLITWQVGQLY